MTSSNAIKAALVDSGQLKEEDFRRAEERAAKERLSLMHALELLAVVPETDLLETFSKVYKIPKANIGEMDIPRAILDLIPKEIALKHRIVPIDRAGNNIIVAMGDPKNVSAINALRVGAGFFPRPVLVSEIKLTDALEKYYSRQSTLMNLPGGAGADSKAKDDKKGERHDIKGATGDGPIVKMVNQILKECVTRRASDIHIEPYETYVRVRLRVDGELTEVARPPISSYPPLISRIKILSKLNIAETRLPQDGAINIVADGKPVDFRVSTLPAVWGEKVVLRILDKSNLQTDMTRLGLEVDDLEKFKASIHAPYGMVLVTGPTGSGKTTTLYSALAELNNESENIMTAEDPVEYKLEGINQIQVKAEIGLTFASALRSFLRQDPDVIMVGEIRDLETAEIAIKAALTGHMVISTLHTNSAAETISRLLNMGVEGFNLVSALNCVTAQRLVRKICEKCRVEDPAVTPQVMTELGIHPQYAQRVKAYKGSGCEACGKGGNRGRIAIHEVLKLSDPVREAILRNEPAMRIKKIAMANGMRSLRQSALTKMVQGVCNVKEVLKTTNSDSDDNQPTKSTAA